MKYKNKHEAGKLNKRFWNEVLVGRTIVGIDWGGPSKQVQITTLKLDNGEIVYLPMGKPVHIKQAVGMVGEIMAEEDKRVIDDIKRSLDAHTRAGARRNRPNKADRRSHKV